MSIKRVLKMRFPRLFSFNLEFLPIVIFEFKFENKAKNIL